MRLKKLVANTTLASLIGSTLITSGCMGQNNETPTNTNNSVKQSAVSSVNDSSDKKMWLDIAGKDGNGVDNKSYLYLQNNEAASEQFAGCDSVAWAEIHIQDYIPSNGFPPMTKDFAAKWEKVFNKDGGMLDPKYLDANYIAFNNQAKAGDKLNCYFNSEDIFTGKTLTKKMIFEVAQHKTGGAETKNEVEEALKDEIKNSPVNPAQLANMVVSDVNMEDYVHKYEQVNTQANGSNKGGYKYLQTKQLEMRKSIENRLSSIQVALENLAYPHSESHLYDIYVNILFGYPASEEEVSNVVDNYKKFNAKYQISNLGNSLRRSSSDGIKDQFVLSFINSDYQKSEFSVKDYLNEIGLPLNSEEFKIDMTPVYTGDDFSIKISTIELDKSFIKAVSEHELEAANLLARSTVFGSNHFENDKLAQSAQSTRISNPNIGNIQPAQQPTSSFWSTYKKPIIGGGVVAGLGVASVLVAWWSGAFDKKEDSVYGNKNTNILEVDFGSATADEVSVWNRSHDAGHQIAADSIMVLQNPGNNVAHQEAKFFFARNDVSRNVGVSVSMLSMSNPHHRLDNKDDPWLGSIGEGSKQRYSSVNLLAFGPASNAGPVQTINYQMARVQAAGKGLTEISIDDRLDAPQLSLDKIVATESNKVLYASGMDGGIFASGKRGMSVDGFDGLFLNPGEDVQFKVRIPTAGNANDIIGGAYAIDFNSTDASAIVPFLVQSKSLKAQYDGKKTGGNGNEAESGFHPTYLYSHFDCDYMSAAGSSCPLTLAVGNMDDEKHDGILTISNQASRPTEVPVHMNYRLLEKPEAVEVAPSSRHGKQFTLTLGNAGSEAYAGVEVSGLPEGIEKMSGNCDNGIAPGTSCQLTFDASNVAAETIGSSYELKITATTANKSTVKGVVLSNNKSSTTQTEFNPKGADSAVVRLSVVE